MEQKIPELARGLGGGIKEFKKATANINDEIQHAIDEPVKTDSGSRHHLRDSFDGWIESDASPGLIILPKLICRRIWLQNLRSDIGFEDGWADKGF